jgi:hypothetical protein
MKARVRDMQIREKIKRAQPSRENSDEGKITFKKIVWAIAYWFMENILALLGMSRKSGKKPGRIRRAIQYVSRPIFMIGIPVGLFLLCLVMWLIFREKKE